MKSPEATTPLAEYINFVPNFFSEDLCERILSEYTNDEFEYGTHEQFDTSYRNLHELNISHSDVINRKNSYQRKLLDLEIASQIGKILPLYPLCPARTDQGYSLRKMETGHFYKEHTDSGSNNPCKLTVSVTLSSTHEGGEFAFFNEELKFNTKAGDLIVFPSTFFYPHAVLPVTEGTRYALVTWFI